MFWPGLGYLPVTELVLRRLLPLAHEGLDRWGVVAGRARPPARHHRAALPDRPQRRDLAGRDAAPLEADGHLDRPEALREMLRRYLPHMHSNVPVHEWPV